ncbi:Protein of unknown function [Solimonas aquatica]|uniref:DUF3429 domain-containing protein n=1 Tax=Solimonas aquatica TaxID=489703 RepID=A0A1H9LQJ6_9GAMM|nr:DUF3429 family protein [Solimonas aquatica]SER13772.1 Protein of unknown function [Solimonas aquatica]
MRLPRLLYLLGYAGLLPFMAAPLWLTLSPQTAPVWLDRAWLSYAAMIAAFMAGSFWGLALVVIENPAGMLGTVFSALMMLTAWISLLLPFPEDLYLLALVFLLLAVGEYWRERTLDPMSSYLYLRITLTVGVLIAMIWRIALHV